MFKVPDSYRIKPGDHEKCRQFYLEKLSVGTPPLIQDLVTEAYGIYHSKVADEVMRDLLCNGKVIITKRYCQDCKYCKQEVDCTQLWCINNSVIESNTGNFGRVRGTVRKRCDKEREMTLPLKACGPKGRLFELNDHTLKHHIKESADVQDT